MDRKELKENGSYLIAIVQAISESVDSIAQARVPKINFLRKVRGSTQSELKTIVLVAFCKKRQKPLE